MLYISRRVAYVEGLYAQIDYGVVDTDDGVEEIVPETELYTAVGAYGMEIAGTTEGLRRIEPYQTADSLKAIQAKTKTLKNATVTVWNNMITNIVWGVWSDGVRLRLSDFGTEIADFVLLDNPTPVNPVTLVFDDKITSVRCWAFRMDTSVDGTKATFEIDAGFINDSVRFDLRELSNNDIADVIYSQFRLYDDRFNFIIDSNQRKEFMRQRYGGSPWCFT